AGARGAEVDPVVRARDHGARPGRRAPRTPHPRRGDPAHLLRRPPRAARAGPTRDARGGLLRRRSHPLGRVAVARRLARGGAQPARLLAAPPRPRPRAAGLRPRGPQTRPTNPFTNASTPAAPSPIPAHQTAGRCSTAATVSRTIAIWKRLVPTAKRRCRANSIAAS